MANEAIKETAKKRGVKLWRVAKEYGIADNTFSRRLREEMPDTERDKILTIIETLAAEGAKA